MENRSLEDTLTEVQLDGFAESGAARLTELTADDYEAINSVQNPDLVVCATHELPFSNRQVTCRLRASSVYVLELEISR